MSDSDDKPPTKEELAAATALANQVDSLMQGAALPPVLDAEARELAELSGMIHAAHTPVKLDAKRQASIIESALARGAGIDYADNDLSRARAKRAVRWPYALGTIIAAAAIAVLVWRPAPKLAPHTNTPVALVREIPASQQSRPGDALVGEITSEASAQAGTRLDKLYGDRMTGYRALHYRKLVGEQ